MIMQWNAMCQGLTSRVLRLLYGLSVGSSDIIFAS
jgi:hypothetical protein